MDDVKQHWSREADAFNELYSEEPTFWRWFNSVVRRGIYERYALTLQHAGDVRGKRILDVGCGSGPYSLEFAKRGASEVIGVDFARPMLDLARERVAKAGVADRCRFVEADIRTYPASEKFDVSIAIGVFDYVSDRVGMLKQLREMTRGVIIASFPGRSLFRMPLRKLRYTLQGCPVYFYTRAAVDQIAQEAGLADRSLVRIESSGGGWLLVGRAGA